MRAPRFRRNPDRRGIEIVELALTLPVLTVIVFGTLETCELTFNKQSLSVAAYEAGRVAARKEGTAEAAQTRFEQIAAARRLTGATFTISPADLSGVAVGAPIQIDVTAPASANNTTNLVLYSVPDLVETVVVLRE